MFMKKIYDIIIVFMVIFIIILVALYIKHQNKKTQMIYAYNYFYLLNFNVQLYYEEYMALASSEFITSNLDHPENEYIKNNFDLYYFPAGWDIKPKIKWHLVGFDHITKTFWCGRVGKLSKKIEMIDVMNQEYFHQRLSSTNQNPINLAFSKDGQ